jgi:serine/threonine protein kinase
VALKILSQRFDAPEARKRFLREGRLAASINHPNSVYVFGTVEIGGVPVIAMELMLGGTLDERVRREGPLDVRAAADAALHIIDGLEAAHAVGILHRDIKPSNCFLDADGTVKIGDFGLSISTEAHGDTRVTVNESFMGTPAFASPEQLRGDELTVRSDIYLVGVTLFYLLTGRLPHESNDMVRLLAKVLENPAPSPAQYRPEIPARLCQAVQRCLAKCPGDRFKNYDELRGELVRFSSSGTQPAGLAARLTAGMIDVAIVGLPVLLLMQRIPAVVQSAFLDVVLAFAKALAATVIGAGYFAWMEGRYGRTLGKALLGLCVVYDSKRSQWLTALLRATVFVVVPVWMAMMLHTPVHVASVTKTPTTLTIFGHTLAGTKTETEYRPDWSWLTLTYWGSLTLLLFLPVRRRNGYAAFHDWLTDSRVVTTVVPASRPALAPADVPPDANSKPMIGPFHVLDKIAGTDDWFTGYDSRLLRRVWIHKVSANTPPVPKPLRNLGRATRLRWITGKRSAAENWDAYESVSGQPLLKLLDASLTWATVRFWLLDLALELEAAQQDGTLPATVDLESVWITADGRAKLLDFPASGLAAPTYSPPVNLLAVIATRCLKDRPLPLPVREFVQTAGGKDPVRELQALMQVPVHVSRLHRLGIVAANAVPPALLGWTVWLFKGTSVEMALFVTGVAVVFGLALPALLAAATAGEGMVLRVFGVAIVGRDGTPATRAQTTRRSLWAWLPCLLSPLLVAGLTIGQSFAVAGMTALAVMAGLAVLSALLPQRSLQDRLAGTWLVPR